MVLDLINDIISGVRSKLVSPCQVVSRPQDFVLRHRPVPVLCHVRVRRLRLSYRRILQQGERVERRLQRRLYSGQLDKY